MNSQERRELMTKLIAEELAKLIPNCGRLSGQQRAYAKGRAWKRFQAMGL